MNKKALVALGVSILLGVVAISLISQYIKNKEKKIRGITRKKKTKLKEIK